MQGRSTVTRRRSVTTFPLRQFVICSPCATRDRTSSSYAKPFNFNVLAPMLFRPNAWHPACITQGRWFRRHAMVAPSRISKSSVVRGLSMTSPSTTRCDFPVDSVNQTISEGHTQGVVDSIPDAALTARALVVIAAAGGGIWFLLWEDLPLLPSRALILGDRETRR